MKFFTYMQNNSGGIFDFDGQKGISHVVIVQADDWQHADYRASRIGLYFDGADDCPCCGTRWDSAHWSKGSDAPEIYGTSIAEWMNGQWFGKYADHDFPEVFVHFANGSVIGAVFGTKGNFRLFDGEVPAIGQYPEVL